MYRFTNKDGTICYWWDKKNEPEEIHKQELANQKLAILEDLEEKIVDVCDITLIVILKAITEGIYVKRKNPYGPKDSFKIEKINAYDLVLDIPSQCIRYAKKLCYDAGYGQWEPMDEDYYDLTDKFDFDHYKYKWALTEEDLK